MTHDAFNISTPPGVVVFFASFGGGGVNTNGDKLPVVVLGPKVGVTVVVVVVEVFNKEVAETGVLTLDKRFPIC